MDGDGRIRAGVNVKVWTEGSSRHVEGDKEKAERAFGRKASFEFMPPGRARGRGRLELLESDLIISSGMKTKTRINLIRLMHKGLDAGMLDLHAPDHANSAPENVSARVKILAIG